MKNSPSFCLVYIVFLRVLCFFLGKVTVYGVPKTPILLAVLGNADVQFITDRYNRPLRTVKVLHSQDLDLCLRQPRVLRKILQFDPIDPVSDHDVPPFYAG